MVNVYECLDGKVIARVNCSTNLDKWDGHNYCRGVGQHRGITKLKDGRFVIIHSTQWQGGSDSAFVVSDEEALQEILESGNMELLEHPKYARLKELYEKMPQEEADD